MEIFVLLFLMAIYFIEQIGALFQKKWWRIASLFPFGVIAVTVFYNSRISTTPIERLENLITAVTLNIFYLSALLGAHAIKNIITKFLCKRRSSS